MRALHNLFNSRGTHTTVCQLWTKLLSMLCVLGAIRVAYTSLPHMANIHIRGTDNNQTLTIPIVRFKNYYQGSGKAVVLNQSSCTSCCPVRTFAEWKRRTASLCHRRQDCPLFVDTPCLPFKIKIN